MFASSLSIDVLLVCFPSVVVCEHLNKGVWSVCFAYPVILVVLKKCIMINWEGLNCIYLQVQRGLRISNSDKLQIQEKVQKELSRPVSLDKSATFSDTKLKKHSVALKTLLRDSGLLIDTTKKERKTDNIKPEKHKQ